MSIGFAGLHVILPTLTELSRNPQASILVLGTMDLLFTQAQLEEFLTRQGKKFTPVPTDQARKTNSFATVSQEEWWKYRDYIHQDTLFRTLGFDLSQIQALDVDDYEHADIIHDLNQPIHQELGQFDLILDLGTLEHIFNVPQALWNLSDLCKVDGHIIHMSPVNFLGHGFYNFSSVIFEDYYDQAGWIREDLFYALFPPMEGDTSLYARIEVGKLMTVPEGFYINVVAKHRKQTTSTKPMAAQKLFMGLYQAWDVMSREDATIAPLLGRKAATWRDRAKAVHFQLKRWRVARRLSRMGGRVIDLS